MHRLENRRPIGRLAKHWPDHCIVSAVCILVSDIQRPQLHRICRCACDTRWIDATFSISIQFFWHFSVFPLTNTKRNIHFVQYLGLKWPKVSYIEMQFPLSYDFETKILRFLFIFEICSFLFSNKCGRKHRLVARNCYGMRLFKEQILKTLVKSKWNSSSY